MKYNPLHPHCGPFNDVGKKRPRDPVDAICWKHDNRYSKLGKKAYFFFNAADQDFIEEMDSQNSIAAGVYGSIFKAKRLLAPQLPSNLEPIEDKMDVILQNSGYRADQKTSMPYYNRRKRRFRMSRRRRRRYGKRRRVNKHVAMRTAMLYHMPKQSLFGGEVSRYVCSATSQQGVLWGGSIRDYSNYKAVLSATDADGNNYVNINDYGAWYCVGAKLYSTIQNQHENPCVITPVHWWMKKDYYDSDYSSTNNRLKSSDTLMKLLFDGTQVPGGATMDGKYTLTLSDGTNYRNQAYVEGENGVPIFNRSFLQYVGMRKGKPMTLGPGEQATFKLVKRNVKRVDNRVNLGLGNNNIAYLYAGHTHGYFFIVRPYLIGTAEADAGVDASKKVATGSYEVAVQYTHTHDIKVLSADVHARFVQDYMPTIATADERIIGDSSVAINDPDQL